MAARPRIIVERAIAFDVLFGLADALAQALPPRGLVLGIELFARHDQAVQRGGALGLDFA